MFWFAATQIVDLIHHIYFYGIQHMEIEAWSLIDQINPTFIAFTAQAIHHSLSASKSREFTVPLKFGPGGGAQYKCDTRSINPTVNDACTDVFHCLDVDFHSSSQDIEAKKIDNIRSPFRQMIHSTGTDQLVAQSHNNQSSLDEHILDYVLAELIEQPDNSFYLSSFVAATEAWMWFSAVLPLGGSAIASSSQPVRCSNSNSNNNEITSITNMTNFENAGFVDGSNILEGAISFGG